MAVRHIYIVKGQVQGVGFRPFIYREATGLGLTGSVGNTPEGVRIEVQGNEQELSLFSGFPFRLPPLARISSLDKREASPIEGESIFRILLSRQGEHKGHSVLVSPDVAPCAECLADMAAPHNRRFGYAFTNCTNCGPRYTITHSIPYDRPVTSMACFPLCLPCRKEYEDPEDRRFHAQPNACPQCGPVLWFETSKDAAETDGKYKKACSGRYRGSEGGTPLFRNDDRPEGLVRDRKNYGIPEEAVMGNAAVLKLLEALKQGKIAAIKGIGGFHLVCDALNADAVAMLRRRKARPHKALAVMTADLEHAERFALLSSDARSRLTSPQRPIVICPRRPSVRGVSPLPDILSPDSFDIGLMLPSSPLHHLLFHPEWAGGSCEHALGALVMTSGNPHGAPICLGNREARERLGRMADVFLFHDRDILVRVDDSVLFPTGCSIEEAPFSGNNPVFPPHPALMVRRARGFVPAPVPLPERPFRSPGDCVLATGAELKHTFCLTRGQEAFPSQHIGDVSRAECLSFFEETLHHLLKLLEVEPRIVVCDGHPDYLSSRLAERFARERGLPLLTLQHHAAHICAVMAEHGLARPVLGLALDGSGLGDDGTIWGGELLLVQPGQWQRLGRFSPFPLPGGEAAIRSPWRTAEALWEAAGLPETGKPWLVGSQDRSTAVPMIAEMLRRNIRCPRTSSCGRLFDAFSALSGLCFDITYEGQAAVRLESAQDHSASGFYELPLKDHEGMLEADVVSFFRQAAADRHSPGLLARRFHRGLARGLARWARLAADYTGLHDVVLAGGVLNNRTLLTELPAEMRKAGLHPLLPSAFPAGDGAIALGQALWGDWYLGR